MTKEQKKERKKLIKSITRRGLLQIGFKRFQMQNKKW